MRFPEFHQSLVFPLEITLVFSRIIVNSGKVRLPHKQSQPSMFQTQFQKGDFPAGLHGIGDTLRFIQQLCRRRALSGTAFARRPETAAVSAAGLEPQYRLSGGNETGAAAGSRRRWTRTVQCKPDAGRGACNLRTDTGICQDIVRELQTAGHRRIGMLCHFAGHPVNWSWISSFIRAMNETALPIQRGSLCYLRMFNAYGGEVLRNVSAIFCINRRNLETILEAAARLGLRIPEDLTVIGTDLPRIPDSRIRHIRPDLCRLADELVRWTDAGQVPEDWIGIPMELVSSEVYSDME